MKLMRNIDTVCLQGTVEAPGALTQWMRVEDLKHVEQWPETSRPLLEALHREHPDLAGSLANTFLIRSFLEDMEFGPNSGVDHFVGIFELTEQLWTRFPSDICRLLQQQKLILALDDLDVKSSCSPSSLPAPHIDVKSSSSPATHERVHCRLVLNGAKFVGEPAEAKERAAQVLQEFADKTIRLVAFSAVKA
jgi:hypothetical protein